MPRPHIRPASSVCSSLCICVCVDAEYGSNAQTYSAQQQGGTSAPVHIDSPVICRVIAMYDFEARDGTELGFKEDDMIEVLNKDDPDWWIGRLNGQIGEFPANRTAMLSVRFCL
jgi:hypothetical protein